MAHEIDMTGGIARFAAAREGAWHRLGRVVPDFMTSKEAMEYGGLQWSVSLRENFFTNKEGFHIRIPRSYSVVRDDSDTPVGLVKSRYVPCQNMELQGFLDAVVGLGAKIETVGSLRGGALVWFLCSLKDSFEIVPGDPVKPYALFTNSHDGTSKGRVLPTGVRVVCANTFQMAVEAADRKKGKTSGITFRHDGNMRDKIDAARISLGLVHTAAERMEVEAKAMAKKDLASSELANYLKDQIDLLGFEKDRNEQIAREVSRYLMSPTCDIKGIRGTAWAAYNAFSEWVDHAPRKMGEGQRLESIWMGEGCKLKLKAWSAALAL